MKVTLIGKEQLSGVSKKTNKPYDFIHAICTFKSFGVDGLNAMTIMLDPSRCPLASIHLGKTYDADYDNRGVLQSFKEV